MNQLPIRVTWYLCRKCNKGHKVLGKRGQAHLPFAPPLGLRDTFAKKEKPDA